MKCVEKKRIKNNRVKRYRRLSGVVFDIFQFIFSPVSTFVDDFRKFIESVGTVRNYNLVFLFLAELAYAVSTTEGWGVANYFQMTVQSGVFTSLNTEVGSTAVLLYRGTFLLPLSVPSLLFKNCSVFGTVDTFFALLSSLLGTICGMEFK